MKSPRFLTAGWFASTVCVLPVLLLAFFYRALWMPDEPREFDIAINMLRDGDFVVPHLAGSVFLEKPPLTYWLQTLSFKVLGVSFWAARIPNLIWTLLAIASLAQLARFLCPSSRKNAAATWVVLLFTATLLCLQVQMWLATDAAVVGSTAAGLLCIWGCFHSSRVSVRNAWACGLGLSLAAGFLAKNCLGVLVPLLTLLTFMTWEKRTIWFLRGPAWIVFLAAALPTGTWLMMLAMRDQGISLIGTLLWDNIAGRFLPAGTYRLGHRSSHFKFLLLIPVYVMPWTLAAASAAYWASSRIRTVQRVPTHIRFCLTASIPAWLILLVSGTARDVYFAPSILGVLLLITIWLTSNEQEPAAMQRALRSTRFVIYALSVIFASIAIAVSVMSKSPPYIFLLASIVFAILCSWLLRETLDSQRETAVALSTLLGTIVLFELVAFPAIDRAENLASVVNEAAAVFKRDNVVLYCPDETLLATLDFRLNARPPAVCSAQEVQSVLKAHPDSVFVAETENPSVAERLQQMFPQVHLPAARKRATVASSSAQSLMRLGLHLVQQWSVSGGRRYGLFEL